MNANVATTRSGSGSVDPPGRLRGFESCATELDDAEVIVSGRLPDWLDGTLLLNGPALWELPAGRYAHWFDGLAMLHRVRFADGGARYRSRFLQSQDYRESIARGSPAFAAFDTPDPESWLERMSHFGSPRITDNGAVVMTPMGGRWIAQTEAPLVTEFDPATLATVGRVAFDDGLKMQLMAAHGIGLPDGSYWNVGAALGPKNAYVLFRVAPGSNRREVLARIPVGKPGYLHAFAMSERHAVIWECALRAQPMGFLFTGRAYIRNFRWQPQAGSRIHAVTLSSGEVRSWDTAALFCFHPVQAFESGADVVVDLCTFDDASVVDHLSLRALRAGGGIGGSPVTRRFVLAPGARSARVEALPGSFDLPQVNFAHPARGPRAIAWGATTRGDTPGAFFNATLRVDLGSGDERVWSRGDVVQVEPLFVRRPDCRTEDDGVLLVPTLADGDSATVVGVVDASTMECLAELRLPQVVPFGFHAAYAPA